MPRFLLAPSATILATVLALASGCKDVQAATVPPTADSTRPIT